MKIEKTFKTISHQGYINGTNYTLEKYSSYYYPYSRLGIGKDEKGLTRYSTDKADILSCKLVNTPTSLNSSECTDQFDNKWYPFYDALYIAYADGSPLHTEPLKYWDACQQISKHANLPLADNGKYYTYCYKSLTECHNKNYKDYEGIEVTDYESMFTPKYKVGDRVFFVEHYDRETRNGERYQVNSFNVIGILFSNGEFYYTDFNPEVSECGCWNHIIIEERCETSVEDLRKKWDEPLYMWHRNGSCSIEECKSTSQYLAYNK